MNLTPELNPGFNPRLDSYAQPSRIFEFRPPTEQGTLVFIHGYRASMSRYPSAIHTFIDLAKQHNLGFIGLELPGHSREQDIHLPKDAPDASTWTWQPRDDQNTTHSNNQATQANPGLDPVPGTVLDPVLDPGLGPGPTPDPLTHHIDSFETYSRSVHQALTRLNLPQAPLYFIGHSMGAAVILQYLVLLSPQQSIQTDPQERPRDNSHSSYESSPRHNTPGSNEERPPGSTHNTIGTTHPIQAVAAAAQPTTTYPAAILLINPLIRIPFSGLVQFGTTILSPFIHSLPNGIPMTWLRAYQRYTNTILNKLDQTSLRQTPTHILLGQRDRVIQNSATLKLAQRFPTITTHLLPGVNHWEVERYAPDSPMAPALRQALEALLLSP